MHIAPFRIQLRTENRELKTEIKKPRAGLPDAGLVSLTMTCLRYLVMNPNCFPRSLLFSCDLSPVTCHLLLRSASEVALLVAGLQHPSVLDDDADPARKMNGG